MAKRSSLEQFKAICNEIRDSKRKPVYVFSSEDVFFQDEIQKVAIELLPSEVRDFNLDILYGEEVSVEKVTEICRSYPLMTQMRVVIVRDFIKMFASERSSDSSNQDVLQESGNENIISRQGTQQDLITYTDRPNPATLLILFNMKRPAAGSVLAKSLKSAAGVSIQHIEPVRDVHLEDWIRDWAATECELFFEDNAAGILAYHIGNNLQQLTVEIRKLASFRQESRPVTEKDVRAVVGISREHSLFELSDAIMARKTDQATVIAQNMLKDSTSAVGEVIKLITFLYTTFGKIWHISRLEAKGFSPPGIQKETGIGSAYYFNKLAGAAKKYPVSHFPEIFETLLDADKAIKGFSKDSPEGILIMTIKKLTH